MKSVAKYDKSCELQDSVNHQILEHKWYPWATKGISGSDSFQTNKIIILLIQFEIQLTKSFWLPGGKLGSCFSKELFKLFPGFVKTNFAIFWADLREEYPLNLSILLSGGQETNKDSLSTGEGSGKSSSLKSGTSVFELWPMEISPWWCQVQVVVGTACPRGLKPRSWSDKPPHRKVFRESCCSGLQH